MNFYKYDKTKVDELTSVREGECKIGQMIKSYDDFDDFSGGFVIIGVSESVGPQANLGFKGSENGFNSFVSRFLNVQSNRFFVGDTLLLYGEIQVLTSENKSISEKRIEVERLDDFIGEHLRLIYERKCVPILIGGGHNNAYPLIKSYFQVYQERLSVINCDPHADYRLLEGRHSGNSFSYANQENLISKYTVFGLHQSYNSEEMIKRMELDGCVFSFFDDYLFNDRNLNSDVEDFVSKNKGEGIGVELDLDSIIGMPSSAYTFSGFTVEEVRKYVVQLAKTKNVKYLHIPEGAPLTNREDQIVGKTIGYLVSDFIKNAL